MRQLRILCVMAIAAVAALALGIALKSPASRAQGPTQSALEVSGETQTTTMRSTVPAESATGAAPTVVASNIGIRTLTVAPQTNESPAATSSPTSTVIALSSTDQPDRIFSFVVRNTPSVTSASATKSLSAPVAGTGATGSVGDGGAASSAELDLNLNEFTMRSGVAFAPDGTLYIADTGNATIRSVAAPTSSEPGIIRSVVGRWAPRQNVELAEPIGIALDRAGNLYIADRGMNAIFLLNGPASPKAGQLETLAHMVSPAGITVSPDGSTVFASSPDSGAVLAINTQTRALRSAAASPAPLFAAALRYPNSASITPTGLAVDGGGNLFIAYSSPGAAYDQILRLDAFSSQLTIAVRGLSEPGDISFDAQGDLFVANQGMRQILKFKGLGVPATGVTLTPPSPACSGGTTLFCDQLIGGTSSPPLGFELSNNTTSTISGVTASFTNGNTTDFTIANSSCAASLAAGASCNFNVAFAPTANATSACATGSASNTRCATFSVNYTGASAPLTTPVSGVADDFQVQCMTTSTFTCPPPSNGAPYQITIAQGQAATFQLQIVPDNTFSGPVTLICPTGLPAGPTGTTASPTTCGISAGTSVVTPLVNQLTLNVTAGTPTPFTLTFQTTTTAGTQTPPATAPPSSRRASRTVAFVPGSHHDGDANGSSGPNVRGLGRFSHPLSRYVTAVGLRLLSLLIVIAGLILVLTSLKNATRQLVSTLAVLLLLAMTAVIGGCHHSSSKSTIPFTPTGTYTLTVQGSAQNAARGFTVTLVVD